MALTVLSVAYPLAPVGRDAVGGAEQILTLLDAALVRAGHRSVVVACEGSRAAGVLVSTPRQSAPLDAVARARAQVAHRMAIERALRDWSVDLVHVHGLDFHCYLPQPGVPVLATLHLPPAWYPSEALATGRPRTYLHCVSASQRRQCPPWVELLDDVPNGVPLGDFRPRWRKRGFALALGRICPEKGLHLAVEAATRAGVPLVLAGQVFPYEAHERYFREELAPRLDAARRFIGPVGWVRKRRLLAAARCLLVPSLVEETSSLVAMEALACGTPVIAFARGALPEVVEHGRTGFLVRDPEEMAEAIARVGELRPEACRRAAEERFSSEAMVGRYLGLYERVLGRCVVGEGARSGSAAPWVGRGRGAGGPGHGARAGG